MLGRYARLAAFSLLSALCLLAGRPAAADGNGLPETVHLDATMPAGAPMVRVWLLEDPDGALAPSDIVSGKLDDRFYPRNRKKSSLGISRSVWWLKFDAENPTSLPLDWVVNFPWPLIDEVDIYHVIEGDTVAHLELGDKRPRSARALPSEGSAALLTTPARTTSSVYVRFFNRLGDGVDTYFEVSSPRAFAESQNMVLGLLGAILGGSIVLFLYSAVIFFSVQRTVYFWYLAYLGSAIGIFIWGSGLASLYYPTHTDSLSEWMPPLFTALVAMFAVQFSRRFLRTDLHLPRFDRVLIALIVAYTAAPVFHAFGLGVPSTIAAMLTGASLLVMPFTGLAMLLKGHREARIFTLAWTAWFAIICLMIARILGIVPSNDLTIRIGWIGIIAEAMIFAFAISERIRILSVEKETAERREREILEQAKTDLERQVTERTQALQQSHDELLTTNQQKDKFFSIIAHDLIGPFSTLIGVSDFLKSRAHKMSAEKIADYSADLNEAATNLHRLLENLLAWGRLQRGDIRYAPEETDLPALLRETAEILKPIATQKGIDIVLDMPARHIALVDPHMVDTIIRNLLGNAIKFSNPGDTIKLTLESTPDGTKVRVIDDGIGMDAEILGQLRDLGAETSRRGTAGETGTGLGLQLCLEMIGLHGGELEIESAPDAGATFHVFFPTIEASPGRAG
ncbi:MAG: sensor histidine kinase [Rhodospirillales bacterium]|nr:sensor histidine kinase [Rhodospirillales bacterium]MBO6785922.1 sensor histidine kinase [Rhodospirillales bacterium]